MGWRDWLGGLLGGGGQLPLAGLATIALSPDVLAEVERTVIAARTEDRVSVVIRALQLYQGALRAPNARGDVRFALVVYDRQSGQRLSEIDLPKLRLAP